MEKQRWYSAEELARAVGCTRKAVRVYTARGLLAPTPGRRYRKFDSGAYERLWLVVGLRKVGLSVDAIAKLLTPPEVPATPSQAATELVANLDKLIQIASDRLEALRRVRAELAQTREALSPCITCGQPATQCHECVDKGKLSANAGVLLLARAGG